MTITLRGGKTTEDPKLDWVYPGVTAHWPSLNYLARETHDYSRPPRSYTWPLDIFLDQGREGACVGFSFAHELAAIPQIIPNISEAFAREGIYWPAQKRDYWDGGSYPGASPFMEGTSVLAGAQVIHEQWRFYDRYLWALDLKELVYSVGHEGPVVAGTTWKTGMMDTDAAGYINATGSDEGGHAYLLRGVRIIHQVNNAPRTWDTVDKYLSYFVVHNSWSRLWGVDGRARLRLCDVEDQLMEGGEFCLAGRARNRR